MQIVEPNQIDILAYAVLRNFQEVGDAQETRLTRQLRRDIVQADRLDRIDFDLTFIHPVPGAGLHVGTRPDPDAARDFSAPDPFAKTFREDHGESLHPANPCAREGRPANPDFEMPY